jgi:alkylation response protein AidB-like acyl-CoA dehydrogenase
MNCVRTVEDENLVSQARRLVPLLRANAEEAARRGRLTVEGEVALRDAGFFTLQSPRGRGSCAVELRTAVEVYRELAHGCSSSAWNSMILSGGGYVASLLVERARDDLWGADPQAAVSISLAPSGASRRVGGGVVASARCLPLSGVDQSGWVMVHVPETDEHGTVLRPMLVLVPISEVSVERTWNVAGMQATGSNTVVLENVFVPEHRIMPFAKILSGGYAADHPEEPLAAGTVLSFLTVTVMGPVLGMAEAALEHTLDILGKGKPIGASLYRNAVDSPSVQFNVAEAASLIDTARLHTFRAVQDVEGGIRDGAQLDLATRARIRMDVGVAAKRAREAVDLLLNVGGARGFALSNPVQRIWRDLETATRHPMLSTDLGREIYARSMLSIEEPVTPWV